MFDLLRIVVILCVLLNCVSKFISAINMCEQMEEQEQTNQPIEEQDNSPKEQIGETTKELIEEALSGATDKSKPWYKRGLAYIIAAALIIVFYLGDKVGDQVIDFLTSLFASLLNCV